MIDLAAGLESPFPTPDLSRKVSAASSADFAQALNAFEADDPPSARTDPFGPDDQDRRADPGSRDRDGRAEDDAPRDATGREEPPREGDGDQLREPQRTGRDDDVRARNEDVADQDGATPGDQPVDDTDKSVTGADEASPHESTDGEGSGEPSNPGGSQHGALAASVGAVAAQLTSAQSAGPIEQAASASRSVATPGPAQEAKSVKGGTGVTLDGAPSLVVNRATLGGAGGTLTPQGGQAGASASASGLDGDGSTAASQATQTTRQTAPLVAQAAGLAGGATSPRTPGEATSRPGASSSAVNGATGGATSSVSGAGNTASSANGVAGATGGVVPPTVQGQSGATPTAPAPAPSPIGLGADGAALDTGLDAEAGGGLSSSGSSSAERAAGARTLGATSALKLDPNTLAALAARFARKAADGASQFMLRLDPPELGRVNVQLDVSADGQAQARLVVERPEALAELSRHLRQLERALQEAGVTVAEDGLELSLADEGEAGFAGMSDDAHEGGDASERDGGNGDTDGSDQGRASRAYDDASARADVLAPLGYLVVHRAPIDVTI